MTRKEVLKLLPEKGVNIEYIPGGEPEVTPSMVSAALGYGRLSENASYYCQIKYQLNISKRRKLLENITKNYVFPMAVERKWKCKIDILPKLVETALYESMVSSCQACKGVKEIVTENKIHICGKCKGTGKHRFSNSEIERRIGTQNFARIWKNRYYRILTIFYNLDSEIEKSLKKL